MIALYSPLKLLKDLANAVVACSVGDAMMHTTREHSGASDATQNPIRATHKYYYGECMPRRRINTTFQYTWDHREKSKSLHNENHLVTADCCSSMNEEVQY